MTFTHFEPILILGPHNHLCVLVFER